MIVVIAAADPSWIIGINGNIPWHYTEDFKRFKALTKGCTVVMGRKTWESLPKKLPGRRNVVISKQTQFLQPEPPDLVAFPADGNVGKFLRELDRGEAPLYVIGGATIYQAAFDAGVVDEVDLTIVPPVDTSAVSQAVTVIRFPGNLLSSFTLVSGGKSVNDPRLTHQRYVHQP